MCHPCPVAQVQARIVVAQAGNPAPGGYSYGPRDNLDLDALITCTNQSNASVTSHVWEVIPAVGHVEGDYGVAGKESSSLTLTPPASTGFGDVFVRLTVRGDPLPNGQPNMAVDQVLLGIRAPLAGYEAGLPIPHPRESLFGGILTLDAARGILGRFSEAVRGLLAVVAGVSSLAAALYGDGSDGPLEVTNGQTHTLDRDRYYSSIIVRAGGRLKGGGYRLFCSGKCLVELGGVIDVDGTDASGTTGGAAWSGNSIPGASGAGSNGGGGAGAGGSTTDSLGGNGGKGGLASGGGLTAAQGTATPPAANRGGMRALPFALIGAVYGTGNLWTKINGGAGGTGGSGTNGGGGGGGAGIGVLCAREVENLGRISANGGRGGDASGVNSGSGGGGGGGVMAVASSSYVGNAPQANGGPPGTPNGTGSSGATGDVGTVIKLAA